LVIRGLQGNRNSILSASSATQGEPYSRVMPRVWAIAMAILVACLLASMVIAVIKL
jgi:hypothetical protein